MGKIRKLSVCWYVCFPPSLSPSFLPYIFWAVVMSNVSLSAPSWQVPYRSSALSVRIIGMHYHAQLKVMFLSACVWWGGQYRKTCPGLEMCYLHLMLNLNIGLQIVFSQNTVMSCSMDFNILTYFKMSEFFFCLRCFTSAICQDQLISKKLKIGL